MPGSTHLFIGQPYLHTLTPLPASPSLDHETSLYSCESSMNGPPAILFLNSVFFYLASIHHYIYFLSCIFLFSSIWVPSRHGGRDCLSQDQRIPQDNQPVPEHAALMPPAHPESPATSLWDSHTPSHYFLCPESRQGQIPEY